MSTKQRSAFVNAHGTDRPSSRYATVHAAERECTACARSCANESSCSRARVCVRAGRKRCFAAAVSQDPQTSWFSFLPFDRHFIYTWDNRWTQLTATSEETPRFHRPQEVNLCIPVFSGPTYFLPRACRPILRAQQIKASEAEASTCLWNVALSSLALNKVWDVLMKCVIFEQANGLYWFN